MKNKLEKDIVETIQKVFIEKRFQLIVLNNLILQQKKELDKDMEAKMDVLVKKFNKLSILSKKKVIFLINSFTYLL